MFTGIVQAVGRIGTLHEHGAHLRMHVHGGTLDLSGGELGESIAVNGCCLTVVGLVAGGFDVDVSPETVARTAGFRSGAAVNLERSLRLADRLGGHLVTGHVDGRGVVLERRSAGDGLDLEVGFAAELAAYIARKGSVTVNGVSLTVNTVGQDRFGIHLIPHTASVTNLGALAEGDAVNLEVDLVARYVERLLAVAGSAGAAAATHG